MEFVKVFYSLKEKFISIDCPTNCKVCTSSTTCDTCIGGFYMYQGLCIGSCPSATFPSSDGKCLGTW